MNKCLPAFLFACSTLCGWASASVITWNDAAGNSSWTDTGNWLPSGIPNSLSDVHVGAFLTGDFIVGIDTGNVTNQVASFTFDSTLGTTSASVMQASVEQLAVLGGISNNDSQAVQHFALKVNAGANATYAGGSGGLSFSVLDIQTFAIQLTGNISISTLNLSINSLASYGSIIGNLAGMGATINIGGTYAGNAGDSFDLTTGSFTGNTLGVLPTLSGGLTWDTSQFASAGVITVVPEPSTDALFIAGGLLLGLACHINARSPRPRLAAASRPLPR